MLVSLWFVLYDQAVSLIQIWLFCWCFSLIFFLRKSFPTAGWLIDMLGTCILGLFWAKCKLWNDFIIWWMYHCFKLWIEVQTSLHPHCHNSVVYICCFCFFDIFIRTFVILWKNWATHWPLSQPVLERWPTKKKLLKRSQHYSRNMKKC